MCVRVYMCVRVSVCMPLYFDVCVCVCVCMRARTCHSHTRYTHLSRPYSPMNTRTHTLRDFDCTFSILCGYSLTPTHPRAHAHLLPHPPRLPHTSSRAHVHAHAYPHHAQLLLPALDFPRLRQPCPARQRWGHVGCCLQQYAHICRSVDCQDGFGDPRLLLPGVRSSAFSPVHDSLSRIY